jgi:hypothetical protein
LLAASLGDLFLQGHPWATGGSWYRSMVEGWWTKLRQAGYTIGSYQPKKSE